MEDPAAPGHAPDGEPRPATALVLVVSEDPLYGEGIKVLLERSHPFRAVYAESLDRARRFCSRGRLPESMTRSREVVLWILDDFSSDAFDAVCDLRAASPATAVCILTHRVNVRVAQSLLGEHSRSMGLLLRNRKPEISEIVSAIGQLATGTAVVEPWVLKQVIEEPPSDERRESLTPMEERVLELVAGGLRNREIARRTHRSEKAIEKHIARLFCKLGLSPEDEHIDRRVTAARMFYSWTQEPLSCGASD